LVSELSGDFPALLNNAPLLLPGEDAAIRSRLSQWIDANNLHPVIVGEFDDSALMKAFGQAGAGLFVAPTAIADHVCEQYKVKEIGRIDSVVEQLYAITTERRLTHPAIIAVSEAARREVFGKKGKN
jgi:LysR family transcriptional activator of nhaA